MENVTTKMTKNTLTKAKRVLSAFHRWRSVADIHHEAIKASDDWFVDTVAIKDRSEYSGLLLWWQRLAPYEVNEIIKGINAIPKARQRAILIMTYLLSIQIKADKQMERLGIKPSTYHKSKNEALSNFAKTYRGGQLERLSD